MNLIYNENKYILKIEKDDVCIGSIQESILKACSLMIYNIENTEFFLKNGKSFILGSNDCIFKEILSIFIKNNVDEIENEDYLLQIDKFIVYDRKRDENGNVIKNNIIIDNYNTWFQENENQKYLTYNTNQNNFYIGGDSRYNPATSGRYFKGSVHNVKIYNRALTSSEILQNYDAQKSRFNL